MKLSNERLATEVKELRMQSTLTLESVVFLKTQILKLVAHKTLTKQHWASLTILINKTNIEKKQLKHATQASWKNQKTYSQIQISNLVRDTIDIDELTEEEQQLTLQLGITKVSEI